METQPTNDSTPIALLVVDMQERLLPSIPSSEQLLNRVSLAIASALLLKIPIYFTEQVPDKLGPTHPTLLNLAGSSASVFAKTAFSALEAEGLSSVLNCEHILITGIETPICIYQTAIQARREGFLVTLLADAMSCRRAGDAAAVITALSQANCHHLPVETVFYSLLGDAQHPDFRDYTALVKQYG